MQWPYLPPFGVKLWADIIYIVVWALGWGLVCFAISRLIIGPLLYGAV